MQCTKRDYAISRPEVTVSISLKTPDDQSVTICSFGFDTDPSGLAALIRTVDLATNDDKVPSAIGLRAKKKKKGSH